VHFQPFATFEDLRDYCRCSADPVGHLILALFGYRDAERRELADDICTGLQLANFWQDVTVDAAKDRIYIPLEDLPQFACTQDDVRRGVPTGPLRALLRFQVERARGLLTSGSALADRVEPRLAREVAALSPPADWRFSTRSKRAVSMCSRRDRRWRAV
jgi:phytoene/squalene synthetase